jgi:hypothetical protein
MRKGFSLLDGFHKLLALPGQPRQFIAVNWIVVMLSFIGILARVVLALGGALPIPGAWRKVTPSARFRPGSFSFILVKSGPQSGPKRREQNKFISRLRIDCCRKP